MLNAQKLRPRVHLARELGVAANACRSLLCVWCAHYDFTKKVMGPFVVYHYDRERE